mmetsp:Transcript_29852/g.50438  ORF Transcript_29852/g.50438 Transcript_29852/m.50438 type:complete len:226 (-) Transcript_29852:1081-1758(-)
MMMKESEVLLVKMVTYLTLSKSFPLLLHLFRLYPRVSHCHYIPPPHAHQATMQLTLPRPQPQSRFSRILKRSSKSNSSSSSSSWCNHHGHGGVRTCQSDRSTRTAIAIAIAIANTGAEESLGRCSSLMYALKLRNEGFFDARCLLSIAVFRDGFDQTGIFLARTVDVTQPLCVSEGRHGLFIAGVCRGDGCEHGGVVAATERISQQKRQGGVPIGQRLDGRPLGE